MCITFRLMPLYLCDMDEKKGRYIVVYKNIKAE